MYGPTSWAGIRNEGGEPGDRGRRSILCCTSNGRDGHDSPERLRPCRALQGLARPLNDPLESVH